MDRRPSRARGLSKGSLWWWRRCFYRVLVARLGRFEHLDFDRAGDVGLGKGPGNQSCGSGARKRLEANFHADFGAIWWNKCGNDIINIFQG